MTSLPYWLASASAAVALLLGAAPLLDEPSEPELAQQVDDDKTDAIYAAQTAKEQ